jgi:hypothetical protein
MFAILLTEPPHWIAPAAAAGYGETIYIDKSVIRFFVIMAAMVVLLVWVWRSWSEKSSDGVLPAGQDLGDSAEAYDAEASRLRALKRKLDAEVELTEAYINAERARGKLDEVAEILRHDRAQRSGGRR